MLDKFKKALQVARQSVWLALAALYPFADQIIAGVEQQMPVLQPYLGADVFRYMGVAIVAAKVALQIYRGWQQLGAMLARKDASQ